MRRSTPRQPSLKECYAILRLEQGADLAALKRAYRRRAFELHPDLHPGQPDAGRRFQLLNEAYVALSAVLQTKPDAAGTDDETDGGATAAKARNERAQGAAADARKAAGPDAAGHATAQDAAQPGDAHEAQGTADPAQDAAQGPTQGTDRQSAAGRAAYAEHDVLRDLLNDPFARRVFEDIYSELNRQQTAPPPQPDAEPAPRAARPEPRSAAKATRLHRANLLGRSPADAAAGGVTGLVKGWLRRQIDEEQSLTLPAAHLAPGKRIRLQIRQAFSGELQTVEITLPPDFAVGKPVRLRGLGKRVGPWQGDLYLTLHNA